MSITFGSDPEFMLKDAKGRLHSAIGVVPGTKIERHSLGNGHQAYYDNVLAECSIDPGVSKEDAVEKFRTCFREYAILVRPLRLVPQASATYPSDEVKHEDAMVFGCDPELCAYTLEVMEAPEIPQSPFRSAGGHIHIGYDGGASIKDDEEADFQVAWNRVWIARMSDLFLGIPSLFMDKDPTSKARRKLYGGAGTHRVCEAYGVEYRPLSNFWLCDPKDVELVYDICDFIVKFVIDDRGITSRKG